MHTQILSTQFFMRRFFILAVCSAITCSLHGMIDNRFRDPVLNHHAFVTQDADTCNLFTAQLFFETASHSINGQGQEVPFFDYDTPFLLAKVNAAIVQAGLSPQSLIPSFWQGSLTVGSMHMTGHFETQGVAFHGYHIINNHWAVGIRGDLFHAHTHLELVPKSPFDNVLTGPGDMNELLSIIQNVDQTLGLHCRSWSAFIFDDVELYVRLFQQESYCYKCRFIDAGLALGLIVPAAPQRDINNPASLSLGGDGHWGMFLDATVDAILRYDLRAGLWLRFQQRFAQTDLLRVPTAQEPAIFGAVVGNFHVRPGFTFFFSPYLVKEGLREGFGLRVGYTLVKHFQDTFTDMRADKTVPVNCIALTEGSEWGQDYITLGFLYDFAFGKVERSFEPVVSLLIDAPVNVLVAQRAARTYGISLVMEANF